jgi:formate hydrogenlyase subunit 6/NADH:ubiquinone oxidoreductase subunit I
MKKKGMSLLLVFPKDCVKQPLISDLVSEHGVSVNILRARISPDEEGRMMTHLTGTDETIGRGLEFLRMKGVQVFFPDSSFLWRENLCVHCGACAGICPSGAFGVESASCEVRFRMEDCILCGLCADVCFYGAIVNMEDFVGEVDE